MIIFFFIFFHAPLTVWLGSQLPDYSLIVKAWKELLILVAAAVLVGLIIIRQKSRSAFSDTLIIFLVAYITLHLILVAGTMGSSAQIIAGLMIDLRYIAFFGVVYLATQLFPPIQRHLLYTIVSAGVLSTLFAVLQITILPKDILASIGYTKDTIAPYLTVDKNEDFIRINGTTRGPNPLGALAMIGSIFTIVYGLFYKKTWPKNWLLFTITFFCLLLVIWFSYSRSAIIGLGVAMIAVVILWHGTKLPRLFWATLVSSLLIIVIFSSTLRDTVLVQNIFFHNNPESGSIVDSDDAHATSLNDGFARMLHQPLGAGIGSTGSASYLSDTQPTIIENQYLFIAHESGWMGLILFFAIIITIFYRLYGHRKKDWLAMSVLSSGIGLLVIGAVLPVFVDDTVSLVWWGLAGITLGASRKQIND